MAAGMHASASGQLGPCFVHNDIANPIECAASQSVEIRALSEEMSLEAAGILQERAMQTRPMGRYGRVLQCKDHPQRNQDDLRRSMTSASKDAPVSGEVSGASAAGKLVGSGSARLGPHPMWQSFLQMMPILQVLPTITARMVRSDVIAGLTVGVMVIPQSMSYASIAGLPYIYGMYSACVPTLIYALFGQSRQLAVGPVAMVSLLIEAGLSGQLTQEECPASFHNGLLRGDVHQNELCPQEYVNLAIMTALVVGLLQIVARLLRLGFLVSFLGHPVTSGFTSAAAVIIGLSQLKYVFGFKVGKSEYFVVTMYNILSKLEKTNLATLFLGIAWIAFLVLSKRVARRGGKLGMLGPLAPLIGCVVGSLLLLTCAPLRDEYQVEYVGEIPAGMFPVSIGDWSFSALSRVWPTALSACLIGYMESIAIGKNLAAKHGYEIDAGQELFALGLSNLVGAMFSCYPVTGSFSRSAVSNATGAVTQLAGLTTSLIMFCTLLFLTKLFYYLPSFVLAAIVISSVIPLVAYDEAAKLWRMKKQDFVLWMTAFIGTLVVGVLGGIALAVVLSLVIVIFESVRPQISILWRIPGTTIYRPLKQEGHGVFIPNVFIARIGSSMYFANASFIKDVLMAYVSDLEGVNRTEYIVLEMTPVVSLDSTAVHVLQDVVNTFRVRGVQIAFAMVGNRVEKTLRKAGLKDFIGDQWFFPTVNEAVLFCLRHQEAKRIRSSVSDASIAHADNPAMCEVPSVHPGDEIGFSNDLHHNCTAIFINLVKDVPMLMSTIAATFSRNHISVRRAQIEASGDGDGVDGEEGTKHTYFVRSVRHPGKLLDWEILALRGELVQAIRDIRSHADNMQDRVSMLQIQQRLGGRSLRDQKDISARPCLEGSEDCTTSLGTESHESSSGGHTVGRAPPAVVGRGDATAAEIEEGVIGSSGEPDSSTLVRI